MKIKQEWHQLLELIKFSLGQGKAPVMGADTKWEDFLFCR